MWRNIGIGFAAAVVLVWFVSYVTQLDFRRQPWSERWYEYKLIFSPAHADARLRWSDDKRAGVWGLVPHALFIWLPISVLRLIVDPNNRPEAAIGVGCSVLVGLVGVKCLDAAIAYRKSREDEQHGPQRWHR